MKSSPGHPRRKRGRRWTPHAIGAGSLALLAFLGGAAPEFLSDDFKQKFAPYTKWIVAIIILAIVMEIVRALVAVRAKDDSPETSGKDQEARQAGFSISDHNNAPRSGDNAGTENSRALRLTKGDVDDLLVSKNGKDKSYVGAVLKGAKLEGADLSGADLTGADLSGADLKFADLSDAILTQTQVIGADLTGAILTGACIENWNVSQSTKIQGARCEYIYTLKDREGRLPPFGDFKAGDFANLFRDKSDILYDLFISYASEDREPFVIELVKLLKDNKLEIWYDEFTLTLGDRIRQSIDRGLSRSRYGIVVLSSAFFNKYWTQHEFDGLLALEESGQKKILPIWHGVSKDDVRRYSPALANRIAISSDFPIEKIVERILQVVRQSKVEPSDSLPGFAITSSKKGKSGSERNTD